ncbi:MAG: T9SS type A sorting domain-containing protein, partial [Cytophagaceae bacterium]|nr:T9SS type A sorting domain-containing protein [Cytophagaceae bacterium]
PAPTVFSIGPFPPSSDPTTLRGTAPANSIVEIFLIEICGNCQPPPAAAFQVEGAIYKATVTADGAGNWSWSPVGGLTGDYTATATEPAGINRNTSEFSKCGYVLPVTLTFFTGKVISPEEVLLRWQTASEENNNYFIIERSEDKVSSIAVGKVNGSGNSSEMMNYSFTDQVSGSGIVYYRLRQVDFDGSVNYSEWISIKLQRDNYLSVYPNPFSDKIIIQSDLIDDSDYSVKVYNAAGQMLYEFSGEATVGLNEISLSLDDLSKGVYFLHVITNEKAWIQKIIKKDN